MASEIEIQVLKTVVCKLDASMEKISEVNNSIGKLLAVHDERLDSLEKILDKHANESKEIHSRITTQTKEIVEKLEAMEARIEKRISESIAVISSQRERINAETKEDIEKINARLSILENWRWYVLGAAAVVGYLLAHYGDLTHLLK